jgi:nitroreductase
MPSDLSHIPYIRPDVSPDDMLQSTAEFHQFMETRRTLRFFSDRPVAKEVIRNLIMTASSAPSGAHKQPWTFCAISDPALKKQIREAAEEEEYTNYHGRMSETWLQDLQAFDTDWHKPFLEIAPWLIVVFRRIYEWEGDQKRNNYYVNESVGLSCGFLLTAIHHAGLVALTHTPSPMNFLSNLLGRSDNERPFLLIPVGYPASDATVPDLKRKTEEQVIAWYE